MSLKENAWEKYGGSGRCKISLLVINTGRGVQALLTGGDSPHIGGVVMAIPRKSLNKEENKLSADYYILPVPGHKDVEVAKLVAQLLFDKYNTSIIVSAGIHSDDLSSLEIEEIKQRCIDLAMEVPVGSSNMY